jgi:non-specific protein-tyrosine kinase
MMSGGAEALKAAIRRSLPLVIVCVVLGAVIVNVVRQLQGPEYAADARVLISSTPISRILTGTEPAFVDPQRAEETSRALARSGEVYVRAARLTGGELGTAVELRDATNVTSGDNDILTITAFDADPQRAVRIANAVAASYIEWRAEIAGTAVRQALQGLRERLSGLSIDDPERAEIRDQIDRLELLRALESADAVFVERAIGANKTSPSPAKDTLLGLSLGLVVGLILAAIREAIDTRVRSESDVEAILSVPVLATLPTLPRRARMVTYGRHERAFGDMYGLLAANVARLGDERKQVIAVTSSVASEGKTTTASNLAVALARRGTRVLLVDFDFRRPALAGFFGIPDEAPGAVQILSGRGQARDLLWSVSLDGMAPEARYNGGLPAGDARSSASGSRAQGSLHVLPAGGPANSQRIAHSPHLAPLIAELRAGFDFVILDTPPALLTVEMTELGTLIDVVLLVVRQGRVTQRSLRSLSRQAQSWPAELVGAVLTDAPRERPYQTYYYGDT